MSRRKAWMPAATPMLADVIPFAFDPDAWGPIETPIGRPLVVGERDALAMIVGRYLAVRDIELNLPSASDALDAIEAVEEAARALCAALETLLSSDGAAGRVKQLFDYRLAEIVRRGGGPSSLGAVYFIAPAPTMLLTAAARVRKNLSEEWVLSDIEGKPLREVEYGAPPTNAWETLICELADFAAHLNIHPTASKDQFGPTSRFVIFVSGIQAAILENYRLHTQSDQALSAGVSSALRRWRNGKNKPSEPAT